MIKVASLLLVAELMLAVYKPSSARGQDVPSSLKVPDGNQLFLHAFAKGVQIYRCEQDATDTDRFSWVLVGPDANLYADPGYDSLLGKHYAGPTWESTDGSKVTGIKIQQANAPDPGSIPWLLLRSGSDSHADSGMFSKISFIQRLATKGGKAPLTAADKAHKGEEVHIVYTAEYFFYRGR